MLGALFICLIPTTIGALLSAIGIAGMDRLLKFNVLATSGRAVEASGDVDTLLLDKTGTITHGNRMATDIIAAPGVRPEAAISAAMMASLADETAEGRSIVDYALEKGLTGVPPKDSHAGAVQRHHPDLRPRRRRPTAGARARSTRSSKLTGASSCRPSSTRRSTASPAPAARRWRWPRTARWSASST